MIAAEIHALFLGFTFSFLILHPAEEIFRTSIPLGTLVDSHPDFEIIVKNNMTTEIRLQKYIYALKQSYENGKITILGWIPSTRNPSDALTNIANHTPNAIWSSMTKNEVNLNLIGWAIEKQEIDVGSSFIAREKNVSGVLKY